MRYNAPYGQVDLEAVYVNGNPATGTEGSIPPALSIELPQREIVAVIKYAADNSFPGCVQPVNRTPTTANTQLLEAIQGFLAQRFISTAITKTVHGGGDFANLHEAMEWVSRYIITQSGYVTFVIAAGKYSYTSTVVLNHPNSDRIHITGTQLVGVAPSDATFQYTGYHNASDGNYDYQQLSPAYPGTGCFATELAWTTGTKGIEQLGRGIKISQILFTGNQAVSGNGERDDGCGMHCAAYTRLTTCTFIFWGRYGLLIDECEVSVLGPNALCSVFNNDSGIVMWGGDLGMIPDIVSVSNGAAGISITRAMITGSPGNNISRIYCRNNYTYGMNINGGSYVSMTGIADNYCFFCYNGADGVIGGGSITFNGNYAEISQNAGWGMNLSGGTVYVNYAGFTGNGSGSIVASTGATVNAQNATGVTGTCSPAINVFGNFAAYIGL